MPIDTTGLPFAKHSGGIGRARARRKAATRKAFAAVLPAQTRRYQGKCAVPWCPNRVEHPHEQKRRGAGGKVAEDNTLPICAACHVLAHNGQLRTSGNPAEPQTMRYELVRPSTGEVLRAS